MLGMRWPDRRGRGRAVDRRPSTWASEQGRRRRGPGFDSGRCQAGSREDAGIGARRVAGRGGSHCATTGGIACQAYAVESARGIRARAAGHGASSSAGAAPIRLADGAGTRGDHRRIATGANRLREHTIGPG